MREDEEFNGPYLPARYKEIVRKKKQQRLLKKAGMVAIAVIVIIIVFVLASGMFGGPDQPSPGPAAPVPSPATMPVTTTAPSGAATLVTTAIPETTIVVSTAVTTAQAAVVTVMTTETPEPVLTARAASYQTPVAEVPKISEKQAQEIAAAAFPNLPAGQTTVELSTDPTFGQVWKFMLRAGSTTEASGLINAKTGTVVTFNRTVHPGGRPQNPVLTLGNARQIADSTINDRNTGILSVNMSDGRYLPLAAAGGSVAGTYRFVYDRMIQDYPCDNDGFIVSVDAVTGAVTEWVQHWESPDNAFMIIDTPTVPRYDAVYAIQAKAKTIHPDSISTLQIVSAERVWKDGHAPGIVPRPSSVPLAWKVIFTDETIQANPAILKPGVGWVDTYTGEIIGISYPH